MESEGGFQKPWRPPVLNESIEVSMDWGWGVACGASRVGGKERA